MRRAGVILLGTSLVVVLVWFLPFHAAGARPRTGGSSTTSTAKGSGPRSRPASLSQVEGVVDASVRIERLTSETTAQLSKVAIVNLAAMEAIPLVCPSPETGCVFGDKRSRDLVVLFGDSHARMWLPAITPIVDSDHLKLVVIGRLGCALAIHRISRTFGGCASDVASDIRIINHMRPAAIILADRTSYSGVTDAQWQAGMTETIDDLRPSGAKIALIGDIQVFNAGMVSYFLECLAGHLSTLQACAVPNPNRAAPGHEHAEERAASLAHALYINTNPWLCAPHRCSPVIGNDIAYWDAFHLSVRYATYLSGVMGSALSPFLRSAIADRRS